MTKAILVILFLLPTFGYAGMYAWTDEDGIRHFSNSPPEKRTGDIRRTEEYVSRDNQETESRNKNDRRQISSVKAIPEEKRKSDRKREQSKSKNVIIYTTPTCGYCRRAKAYLDKHGVKYTEYDIKASEEALKKFQSLGGRGVPLIVIGERRITGFNESAINSALGLP